MNTDNNGVRVCGWLLAWLSAGLAFAATPPPAPRRSEIERILSAAPRAPQPAGELRPLNVVLVADRKDHGPGEHDYPRWQSRWALLLGGAAASTEKAANLAGPDLVDDTLAQGAERVRVATAQQWPEPPQWAAADVVVAFCYLTWTEPRLEQLRRYLERGGGLVLIHSATWTKPKPSPDVAGLTGVGGFQRWRHGPLTLKILQAEHPVCRGLPPEIHWDDESYWPPTPALNADRVQVLAGSQEQAEPGGGATAVQPMFWTCERGKGRVFGCVPGHNSWTFDDPYFRLLLLRGLAWAAGEEPERFDGLVLRSASVRPD